MMQHALDPNRPPRRGLRFLDGRPVTADALKNLEAEILRVAAEQKGRGEDPTLGNNRGADVEYFRAHDGTGRSPNGAGSWCAAFCSYVLVTACARLSIVPPPTSRGARRLAKNIAATGSWVIAPGQPIPANPDIRPAQFIAWRRRGWRGHIEIVYHYNPDTNTIYTWAGNVNNHRRGHKRCATVHLRAYPAAAWRKKLFGVAALGLPTSTEVDLRRRGDRIT